MSLIELLRFDFFRSRFFKGCFEESRKIFRFDEDFSMVFKFWLGDDVSFIGFSDFNCASGLIVAVSSLFLILVVEKFFFNTFSFDTFLFVTINSFLFIYILSQFLTHNMHQLILPTKKLFIS